MSNAFLKCTNLQVTAYSEISTTLRLETQKALVYNRIRNKHV